MPTTVRRYTVDDLAAFPRVGKGAFLWLWLLHFSRQMGISFRGRHGAGAPGARCGRFPIRGRGSRGGPRPSNTARARSTRIGNRNDEAHRMIRTVSADEGLSLDERLRPVLEAWLTTALRSMPR